MVTVWAIWQNVGEPGFTSITASASGFEKSGLSSTVYAKFSGGASIASFGDAWKVGSGLIVIGMPPCCYRGAQRPVGRARVPLRSSGDLNLAIPVLQCRKKLLKRPRVHIQIAERWFRSANHLVSFQQPDLITGQRRVGQ